MTGDRVYISLFWTLGYQIPVISHADGHKLRPPGVPEKVCDMQQKSTTRGQGERVDGSRPETESTCTLSGLQDCCKYHIPVFARPDRHRFRLARIPKNVCDMQQKTIRRGQAERVTGS